MPASSSTGTVSDATSAVETPRPPIPFSAATCRSAASLTKLSANDWLCSPLRSLVGHLGAHQRQHQGRDRPVHVLAAWRPAGLANRNPVCIVPGVITIRVSSG